MNNVWYQYSWLETPYHWHQHWKMGNDKYFFETEITKTWARCFKMKLYNSCLSCHLMYKIDVRTFFKRFLHMTAQFEICISLFRYLFCNASCICWWDFLHYLKSPIWDTIWSISQKTKLILESKARHENYFLLMSIRLLPILCI